MLEDVKQDAPLLGKGRFGTVVLQKFRSTPVAVKYFDQSTTSSMVEKEAKFLQECRHINLPIIFGMNNSKTPYFIATQFYGNENDMPAVTLHDIVTGGKSTVVISGHEHWLHITAQLVDALVYLHKKKILHNDIKCDNILIAVNTGLFSPILIDFGKASVISEARKKTLSMLEQKRYRKEHCHIAPEIVDGTQPQSVKSDIYSVGVVLGSTYAFCKYRPLKEIAKRCLRTFTERCTTEQLHQIVEQFK